LKNERNSLYCSVIYNHKKRNPLMNDYIRIPSGLEGFSNTGTKAVQTATGRPMYLIEGTLAREESPACPRCGARMHVHDAYATRLRHLAFGRSLTALSFVRRRYVCPACHAYSMQQVPFKSERHRMTRALEQYARDLLAHGLTNTEVAMLTGLGRNTVKDIDLQRLRDRYTQGGARLRKPGRQARHVGVDEFLLHAGHRYAVIFIDLDTGHVLFIARGRKKQTVHDFIDFVGEEWMDGVEAAACDMNSDFHEMFEERCRHIQVVFDHFHILKKTRYILTASRATLEKRDREAAEGKMRGKAGTLFGGTVVKLAGGRQEKYRQLLESNALLLTADIVKEKLAHAYTLTDEALMAREMWEIMDLCDATGNRHFRWFPRLLSNHFEGIIAHATFRISTGKVEGYQQPDQDRKEEGLRLQG
jgi:transposase